MVEKKDNPAKQKISTKKGGKLIPENAHPFPPAAAVPVLDPFVRDRRRIVGVKSANHQLNFLFHFAARIRTTTTTTTSPVSVCLVPPPPHLDRKSGGVGKKPESDLNLLITVERFSRAAE